MPILDLIFGKRKTPAEVLRENKRMLDRAIRWVARVPERALLRGREPRVVFRPYLGSHAVSYTAARAPRSLVAPQGAGPGTQRDADPGEEAHRRD